MMDFIKDSKSYDEINPELAYRAGLAFGEFQKMLADLPGGPLFETIPNFHNIESRLATFRDSVAANKVGRLAEVNDLVNELEARADEMCKAERMYREGKLIKRTNHCDTKVNNILFDRNDNVLCVVDLDTVMPGYVLSDGFRVPGLPTPSLPVVGGDAAAACIACFRRLSFRATSPQRPRRMPKPTGMRAVGLRNAA